MSALSISNALVSCELLSEESLTSSQLTLSCTFQSFFIEATSRSALLSLAVGQGCAAVVQSQGYRLLSPLFHPKTAQVLATAASYITEGICFNTAAELGRSGRFTIGSPGECLYGITTIAVCKGMGKGVLSHNAVVRNIVQNSALMTVDILFEKCQLIEQRNLSILDRYFSCQLTSFRMEISATLLANACPAVGTLKATQELDYNLRKSRETLPTSKENGRFFDPLQDMFAPALAGNNGQKVRRVNFEPTKNISIEQSVQILMMASNSRNSNGFSRIEPRVYDLQTTEQTPSEIAHGFVKEAGLEPTSEIGQLAVSILSHRVSLGENIAFFTPELARVGKTHLEELFRPTSEKMNETEIALLLAACGGERMQMEVTSAQWSKLLKNGLKLIADTENIQRAIRLAEKNATDQYRSEIERVKTAILSIRMLIETFSNLSISAPLSTAIHDLFYSTLSKNIQTVRSFKRIFTAWHAALVMEVIPLLERIKAPCKKSSFWVREPFDAEQTSQEGSFQSPEEGLEVKITFKRSHLDADSQKRNNGAAVLIRLSKEGKFNRRSLDSFTQIFSDHFTHQFKTVELKGKGTNNPFFLITQNGIQFSVRIILEGKSSSPEIGAIDIFPEADTVKFARAELETLPDTVKSRRISEDPQKFYRRFNHAADCLWLGASYFASPVTGQAAIFGWVLSQLRIPTAFAALASGTATHLAWNYHQGYPHPIARTALFTGLASLYALVRGRMLVKESRGNPHPFKSRPNAEIPQLVLLPAEVVDPEKAQDSLKTRAGIITIDGEPDPVDGFPKAFTWGIPTQGKGFSSWLRRFYKMVDSTRSSVSIGHLSQMPGTGLLFYPFAWGAGIDLRGFKPRNGKKIYYSWDAGFTRERRDNYRFMEGSAPSDGKVIYIGRGSLDQVIQIKGHTTTVKEFLGEEASQHFPPDQEVIVVVTYLSPKNLHLGYAPSDGKLLVNQQIPGKAYTVGTKIWDEPDVDGQPGARYLAWQNRYITAYKTNDGIIAEGYVAATYVYDAEVYPIPGEEVKAGQHVQTYHYGSTNVSIRPATDFAIPHNLAVGVDLTKGKTPFLIPRRVLKREI